MADITKFINDIMNAETGEELRGSIIDALIALNNLKGGTQNG